MKAIKIFKIKDTEGTYVEIGAVSVVDLKSNLKHIDFSGTTIEFDRVNIEKSDTKVISYSLDGNCLEIVNLNDKNELVFWTVDFEENLKKYKELSLQ